MTKACLFDNMTDDFQTYTGTRCLVSRHRVPDRIMKFKLVSKYKPTGDQPKAIQQLTDGYFKYAHQTLLGVTGSGKTFTMANVIQNVQKPTLVLSHNKTLAAQLYEEFKEFFPNNKVCYFISYYDYYQPESYLPASDTYIEKESEINEKIEQYRLEAGASLMSRNDVIIVSSVSCIYGFGDYHQWKEQIMELKVGQKIKRSDLISQLVELLYERNDLDIKAGKFRVRGDVFEIIQGYGGEVIRIELFGDEIEQITRLSFPDHQVLGQEKQVMVYPAKPFLIAENRKFEAIKAIRKEMEQRVKQLPPLEAHRLRQRTSYDLEMIEQFGYCKGVENYSRHFDGRPAGSPPQCILDFFPKDFLLIIDESHVTLPQVRGMHEGDKTRKKNLIDYGFRLPSAYDNRPLKFEEFEKYLNHVIYTSATPSDYELKKSKQVVEQIIRPTGLVDPPVEVRPVKDQIRNLKLEIGNCIDKGNRVLITTLTKRMAEELTDYLLKNDVKARYLHSEIDSLERTEIIRDLRLAKFDVLVGINLLREGLDIPEVSLVAILDADQEGFLRNARSLIQTAGRAARNVDSKVIMYADEMTQSMKTAIKEMNRRRKIQLEYNQKHNIKPQSIIKAIRGLEPKAESAIYKRKHKETDHNYLVRLEAEMKLAAENLDFEKAIELRDKIEKIRNKN